ncbi:hypothetical protein H0H93_006097 [Arthromyces matolae]|nr:hypothetical protein H0H93_006097 [Arthromyces matolae]
MQHTPSIVQLRTPQHPSSPRTRVPSIHWLFRSNIPRRRSSYLPPDIQKRNFFGMGEIVNVMANPAETVRSLTESRRLLEEARRELEESKQRSQLRPKHTFSRFPGFFTRKAEILALERALEGEPSFTILFGASSTGKVWHIPMLAEIALTALLREVLSREHYHVLHFDLRIAGFADISSLYQSLSQQMELYFEEIAAKLPGYEEFRKEAWNFKFDRQEVQGRVSEGSSDAKAATIRTSDIARLMELFQSSLLKYWEFKPSEDGDNNGHSYGKRRQSSDNASEQTHVDPGSNGHSTTSTRRWTLRRSFRGKDRESPKPPRTPNVESVAAKQPDKTFKKMPVIFFDESHKLPALIQSTDTMKCLLDSMLVLTKQDRLCHVIHATSDPFYQTWLRQFNIMQHCEILDIDVESLQCFELKEVLARVSFLVYPPTWSWYGYYIRYSKVRSLEEIFSHPRRAVYDNIPLEAQWERAVEMWTFLRENWHAYHEGEAPSAGNTSLETYLKDHGKDSIRYIED